MSGFGWSAGDIVAGLKLVWDVWKAVSDGPMSAKAEAKQFFEDFDQIIQCLDDWEHRDGSLAEGSSLAAAPSQLQQQCVKFLSRHMQLIRTANPQTAITKQGVPMWLRKVAFSGDQIKTLYLQISWPFERDQVLQLRTKMELYLSLATYKISALNHSVAQDTNNIVREISTSHQELLSSNLKLVSSHLELVSLITQNLKRVTHPLESNPEMNQIDYPMLRQLEQALAPPQPLRAVEALHDTQHPWQDQHDEDPPNSITRSTISGQHSLQDDGIEKRYVLSQRLENLAMRRVESINYMSTSRLRGTERPVDPLISRLQDMRGQIFDAVGIKPLESNITAHRDPSSSRSAPENALLYELEAWNQLETRIQREILHPARISSRVTLHSTESTGEEFPFSQASPRSSGGSFHQITGSSSTTGSPLGTSPNSHFLGIPQSNPTNTYGYSPFPHDSDGSSRHNRALSNTSISPSPSVCIDPSIAVYLSYPKHAVNGFIQSIVRSDNGEVIIINTISQDGCTEFCHSVDPATPSTSQTSMIPFIDNRHADTDKTHRYRVNMQGSHRLKVTKSDELQGQKILRHSCSPNYTFHNEKDFLEFHRLILLKEVKHYFDVQWIKSLKDKESQCRLSTIQIIRDAMSRTRYILYFRKSSDRKSAFEEWPVSIFKEPRKPKTKSITLESLDDRPLHEARKKLTRISRNNTQGSITTIGSQESTNGAYERLQDRSTIISGRSNIKGLIIKFCDTKDCHTFWQEFTTKESIFDSISTGTTELGIGDPRHSFAELAS
ncbi:uncharacterized protein EAE97_010323 [Botrytis byssoidea]|uniref:Fungal N-terminal domain-containing protein n=1 Tax=Botrytis byssoidea TaxID=139641 RepID=A0A9P5LTS4_9HELO|nr:uncharacterized protein EAE97_010323 [Botrytis byssoidea]KAF7926023.1 hypothetical protein EAE97_010323 [Botrytis byssoidea]